MKQKILFLFFTIVSSNGIYAQGEAAHWHFGHNSGIDFTQMATRNDITINGVANQTLSGIPTFESGPINTIEGCFSISDKNGNFLFASDGSYVYNRNKALMPHGSGLKGDASATQSGIVIPRPKHPDNYYIVTTPATEGTRNPIYVYEVDMTEDGGLGDLVGPYNSSGQSIGVALNFKNKNTNIDVYPSSQAYENIAAVGHGNGIDYWLVHRCRSYFFVWLVTENGISEIPDQFYNISVDMGIPSGSPSWRGGGYLKFSTDGQFLACAAGGGSTASSLTVAKFDIQTGAISNIKAKSISSGSLYSISFSPNNKYLYYSFYYKGPLLRLSVDNLLAGINETPYTVKAGDINNIQLGPDSRLYGIAPNKDRAVTFPDGYSSLEYRNLFVIPNPDDDVPDLVSIPDFFPDNTGSCLSLPTFTSSFFNVSEIEVDPVMPACINKEITFSVQIATGSGENRVTKLEWGFGDGSPTVEEIDMDKYTFIQKHTYSHPGTYTLTLTPYKSDGSVLTSKIQTMEVPIYRCVMPVNPNIHVLR